MNFAILIVFAYLLGSIPFGLLIAKAHRKDLRTIGSGNIGATNLARAMGTKWGILCFCFDALKGLLPMLLAGRFYRESPGIITLLLTLAAAFAAVLGHVLPIYLRFKGGKGVATSFGVTLGLWPYYTLCSLISFVIWAIMVLIWKYVSLASIVASLVFPIVLIIAIAIMPEWYFASLWPLFIVAIALPIMVIIRHRTNIRRLIEGTEGKALSK
jgi:glycerol-3-phosphate acyltransferase PlsY